MEKYIEINPELLNLIKGKAWSIENMAAHGAGGRAVQYLGSQKTGHMRCDYYKDTAGAFWYKTHALLPTGEAVSMDKYIFGREIRRTYYRHT